MGISMFLQIKDEQGNFKSENFSELRHVAFNIRDPDSTADGEKSATANPGRSVHLLSLIAAKQTKPSSSRVCQ